MSDQLTDKESARFRAHISAPDPETACQNWNGGISRYGYGKIYMHGKEWKAHRLAYTIAHGAIPPRMLVCHRCDNRKCVNPEHLFLGDHKANNQDMWQKGRGISGEQHWARRHPDLTFFARTRGESHLAAKLNLAKIVAMHEMWRNGIAQKQIANSLGVDQSTVSRTLNGKRWQCLSDEISSALKGI